MSWDLTANKPSGQEGSGGGKTNFTKFETGVTEIRVLDKTPYMRWSHWLPQYSRRISCSGMDCPICALNKRAKASKQKEPYDNARQWSLNLYNYNTGQYELNEQGLKFMEELRIVMEDLKADGKDLDSSIVKVTKRQGSDGKAVWRMDVKQEATEPIDQDKLVDRGEYFKAYSPDIVAQLLSNPAPSKDSFIKIVTGAQEELQGGDVNGSVEGAVGDIGTEVKFETE